MAKLQSNEFRKLLRERMTQICEDQEWNIDTRQGTGYSFQLWCAETVTHYDLGIETDPEDSLLYSKDLKADFVLEDSSRQHLIIGQTKYVAPKAKNSNVDESEVNDFFHRHDLYMNRDWVRAHGSERAFDLLGDYAEKIDAGYAVDYYFISTGLASQRVKNLEATVNEKWGGAINCRLYDFTSLKDFFVRSQSLEESIPDEIRINLPHGQWFEREDKDKSRPFRTVVTVLKGNALRNIYRQYKEAVIAYNIRSYLGDRGINKSISETAEKHPNDFFYFNNGISAICTDYVIEDGILITNKLQIINGAQTLGALAHAAENPDVEVLVRITKTLDVTTEKGLNQQIILYNNSQNVIKVSDFRSNDPIQIWLERKFSEIRRIKGPLPKIKYVRRRGTKMGGRGTGKGIKLEDAGKIRYSFLHEPTLTQAAPRDLWTLKVHGGVYENAFGVHGELQDLWSDETFVELLVAIAYFLRIDDEMKSISNDNNELISFRRLKYHALSLAGIYLRARDDIGWDKLAHNTTYFDSIWDEFWPEAYRAIIGMYSRAINDDLSTVHALVRSNERWQSLRRDFGLYVARTVGKT